MATSSFLLCNRRNSRFPRSSMLFDSKLKSHVLNYERVLELRDSRGGILVWNIIFLLSFFFKIPPEKSVRSILLDGINYWWESGEQETIPWIFPDLHTNLALQRRNKFLEAIKKVTWSIDSLLWRIVSWFSSPKTFHFIFRTRIEFLIKLINRANYFFFARASFLQLFEK